MLSSNRSPLPVTEAALLEYIGYLVLQKEQGRRSVSPASLPQYLSAIRVVHFQYYSVAYGVV